MSNIIVRPLSASDVEQTRLLHSSLIPVPYPTSFFLHFLIQPSHSCLIAVDEKDPSSPIAFVSASLHQRGVHTNSPEPHIQLLTLGVHPDYQQRGIAKRLIAEIIASLNKDPASPPPPLYTHVCTTNTTAQAFYKHLGLKVYSPQIDAPFVARNVYPPCASEYRGDATQLFRSRDAYVLVGRVAAA